VPSPDDHPPTGPPSESPPLEKRVAPTETYVELMERLAPGTRVAGRYRIVSIAGVGGMGVVYRAADEELSVDVALKVLRQDLGSDPRVLERFRGELLSARQVTHKNVVRLHDIGEHAGMRFLTMDFVEGRSLKEILERDGPLPLEKALSILRQVAEGLGAAHEKGIVHRDLKPGNILIDPEGRAFITDFGVARSLGREGLTRAGAIVGTPDYLAPEQVSGDPVDGRTDLYALGIVFYESLSGELPFRGDSQTEALAQRLAGRHRDLRETGVAVPGWVREVIRRCLERSPSRRYPTARALIEDLDRRAPATARRMQPVALIASAAVLILAGGVFLLVRHRAGRPAVPASSTGRSAAPARALHSVAVLPFADQTGDAALAWAGPGMAEMLSSSLSESPNLRVLDSLRVARGIRDLRVPAGSLEMTEGKQLAELWSVDTLISGTVRRAGTRLRVDFSILQFPPSGAAAVQSFSSEGQGDADIFRLASSASVEVARRLGISSAAPPKASEPQTSSLAAAKAYEEGRALLTQGDDRAAAPAFERAVAADPRFGAALERLAETYQNLGHHQKAVEAADRALATVGSQENRLSRRVRARVALLAGKPSEAEKLFRELLEQYPNLSGARLDLATAQAAQGHHADAVATLKKLVEADPNDPQAWLQLGRNAVLMGDSAKAVQDYLVRALALQSQFRNEKGKADVLVATAGAYQRMSDYRRALENYAAAWKIQSSLGDERGLATTLRNRALVYQLMGKIHEAEADLQSARALFEKIGDRLGMADAWNASGVIEESRGAYTRALEAYQNSLKLRRTLGNERLLAQSYDNVGYIYYLQGEYDNALVYWQQALDLRRKISHKSGVVLSVLNMGFLQTAQGHWDDAVKSFLESLERSREIDQKDATVISLGNLGILHQLRGRFSAALSSFDEALAIARGMQYPAALIEFNLKKGSLLLELGRAEETGALVAQAEKWVGETGNEEQKSDLEVLRGDASLASGDRAAARKAYERAVPLARKSGSRVSHLRARLARAEALANPSESARELSAVLAEAESLGHAALTLESSEALGRQEIARRRFPEADRILQKAAGTAERAGWNEGLYRLYALRARALEGLGNRGAAAEELARSAREIAKLRENVPPEMRVSFENLPAVREVLDRARPGNGKP
jgi:tetratricopeptide (TPR) repeat protein/TolB-like protein